MTWIVYFILLLWTIDTKLKSIIFQTSLQWDFYVHVVCIPSFPVSAGELTHWSQDKMDATLADHTLKCIPLTKFFLIRHKI